MNYFSATVIFKTGDRNQVTSHRRCYLVNYIPSFVTFMSSLFILMSIVKTTLLANFTINFKAKVVIKP